MKFEMKPISKIKSQRKIGVMEQAQKYIDSECIRRMDKYTKRDTGALIKSATTNTKIGSGKIIQRTPYARLQYYNFQAVNNDTGLRGPYWFKRMKADNLTEIKRRVAKITGGRIG